MPTKILANRAPSIFWRIAFWSIITAWVLGWIYLAIFALLAFLMGFISIWAGTLAGFTMMWPTHQTWIALGLVPPIALMLWLIGYQWRKPRRQSQPWYNLVGGIFGGVILAGIWLYFWAPNFVYLIQFIIAFLTSS